MKKTDKKLGLRARWKKLYEKRSVRIIHLILQYIIIIFVLPVLIVGILHLLDYLWEERPGLLLVAIPGTYLAVCSVCYIFRDKKIRRSLEEEGKFPKDAKKRIIHDTILITEIFAVYILAKCIIKYVLGN